AKVFGSCRQNRIQVLWKVFGEQLLMTCRKNALMLALKIQSLTCHDGTGELIVQQHCIGVVYHAQVPFPKTCTVVGLLVIRWFEPLVESPKLLPDSSGR